MQEPPDWVELVERARRGERAAQALLLGRFTPLVRGTASRLIDADRVDDVAQESFAEALRRLPALRTPEAFPSWMRLIVRKQASRVRRASLSTVPLEDIEPADRPDTDPAAVLQRRDLEAIVRVALNGVGDTDRRLLELRYLAGWTTDELADLLGIRNATLRKRLHDARRRLRRHLDHLDQWETPMTDYRSFLDAVHDADLVVPAGPALSAPDATPTTTGLKVIDTMAPVRRGGTIEMVGPSGTGHLVLGLELLYRLGRSPHDVACVAIGVAGVAIGGQPDFRTVVTEPGIPGPNAAILSADVADAPKAFTAGTRLAAGLAGAGLDVVLVADGPTVDAIGPTALAAAAGLSVEGSVTVIAVRALDRGAVVPSPLGLDTMLVFSVEQFALGIFPAIDPTRCTSIFPLSEAAAATLHKLSDAAQLRAWFDQAMYLAEDHTGEPGIWTDPTEGEAELAALNR